MSSQLAYCVAFLTAWRGSGSTTSYTNRLAVLASDTLVCSRQSRFGNGGRERRPTSARRGASSFLMGGLGFPRRKGMPTGLRVN